MAFSIRRATTADAELVGSMVARLLATLRGGAVQEAPYTEAANRLIGVGERVVAFLAFEDNECIGVMTLNECAAIYNGGPFGQISELYVSPDARSKGIGSQLLNAAVKHARERGWPKLEVGAPSVPTWQRTVDFYKANGFFEIGPRLGLPVDD